VIVKICGITRLDDAKAAVERGANAIGFVFWKKSPRFIDPYRARMITATLPPFVTPVGVFVDQPIDEVAGIASLAHLGAVQLHGAETPAYAAAIGRPIVKAVTLNDEPSADVWPAHVTLLIDAHDPVKRGGTGRTIDWTAAASMAALRPCLLAGGLTPDNIADAIARVHPFGVDISSGVESAPGIKDHRRLTALFEAIHGKHVAARS